MTKKERAELYARLTSDDFEVRQAALAGLKSSTVRIPTVQSKTTFGGLMRKHRLQKGLTQSEVAVMIGASKGGVNHWELGNATPSVASAVDLCNVLGITPAELFKCFPEVRNESL